MTEFEYTNELYYSEVKLIVTFINKEIALIKKNKNNLKKFLYSENIKGKLPYLDFDRIVSEIERMAIEVKYLEEKRLEYFKIQEHQEQHQERQEEQQQQ